MNYTNASMGEATHVCLSLLTAETQVNLTYGGSRQDTGHLGRGGDQEGGFKGLTVFWI